MAANGRWDLTQRLMG